MLFREMKFSSLLLVFCSVCIYSMQFQALEELQVTFPIFIIPHKAIP